jgi:hypothetical protein
LRKRHKKEKKNDFFGNVNHCFSAFSSKAKQIKQATAGLLTCSFLFQTPSRNYNSSGKSIFETITAIFVG